jgi:hypothetical protein
MDQFNSEVSSFILNNDSFWTNIIKLSNLSLYTICEAVFCEHYSSLSYGPNLIIEVSKESPGFIDMPKFNFV